MAVHALLLAAGSLFGPVQSPLPLEEPRARVELLLASTAIEPGGRVDAALRFEIDDHWHLYWSNPGDSGLPPRVHWELPEGLTASPLEWPVPARLEQAGLVTFVYEEELVLPFTFVLAESARAPEALAISGKVSWLVCREECLAESDGVAGTLRLGAAGPGEDESAARIRAARATLPAIRPTWTLTQLSDEAGVLALALRYGDSPPPTELVPALFLPERGDAIDLTGSLVLRPLEGGGVRLELPIVAGATLTPPITGLLRFAAQDGTFPLTVRLSTPDPEPPSEPTR